MDEILYVSIENVKNDKKYIVIHCKDTNNNFTIKYNEDLLKKINDFIKLYNQNS